MRHPAWGRGPAGPISFPTTRIRIFARCLNSWSARAIEDWRYLLGEPGPGRPFDQTCRYRSSATPRAVARFCATPMPTHPAFGGLLIEINSSELIDHPDPRGGRRKDGLAPAQLSRSLSTMSARNGRPCWSFGVSRFAELKVDQQYINGCANDRLKQTVCRRIVELARDNGARAIAPGRGDPRGFSCRSRHGVRSGPGLPVRQAGGGTENLLARAPELASGSDKPS